MGSACTKGEQVEEAGGKVGGAAIELRIAKENKAGKHVRKLLLLGAGESGKSTIFKQIKVLFQSGFDDVERLHYASAVHTNVYEAIGILLDACQEFSLQAEGAGTYALQAENRALNDRISEMMANTAIPSLDLETAQDIDKLWRDPAVQAAYLRANELQLPDCSTYFLENIHRLAQPGYVPTAEDVMYARVRTTGIVETVFSPRDAPSRNPASQEVYKMFDVGGQRNERRKWIHLFEGVTAVIFCAALSDYDQTLFEDDSVNRMMETKELFEWVLKQPWFEKTSFLVFLNKFDIFKHKVLQVPLTVCDWFQDYKSSSTGKTESEATAEVEHALKYVKQKFRDLFYQITGRENSIQQVFEIYETTALDQMLVKRTFSLVDKTLTRQALIRSDLL